MNALPRAALALLAACPFVGAQEDPVEEPPVPIEPVAGKYAADHVHAGDEALRAGHREEAAAAYRAAMEAEAEQRKAEEAEGIVWSSHRYEVIPRVEPRAPLVHAVKTPPETRTRIDALVRMLLDPFADERDAAAAAKDLVAIGPPMIHPLLGALVAERDRLEGKGTLEDGLRMTSLRRGDACLRALDPFLDAVGKAPIDAKSDREHVTLVLGVHYARSGSVWGARLLDAFDPPADLPHLDDTPEELRRTIDAQVALLLDPMAGRDSLLAKEKLVAIGKPAFPRILGAMAGVAQGLGDEDTLEERLAESALHLADQCLRQMDGYCEAKNHQPIRPGTDSKYVRYVLKIHYKRWRTFLKDLKEMPGPYDPTKGYD